MADICDYRLGADISASCSNPQKTGVQNTGWIMNYDDVDWDAVIREKNLVSSLSLLEGRNAYKVYIPGKTPFTGTQKTMNDKTYFNDFNKTLALVVLNSGPEVSENIIDPMANGRFVVVIENKYRGEDGKATFEIFGFDQGLTATEMTSEKYSEDTNGGWAVTLVEEGAPNSGIYFFNGDVASSRASLESLVA